MKRLACLFLIAQALSATAAPAPAPDLDKKAWHHNETMEKEIGYSSAMRVGDTLYISGHVGVGEMPAAIKMTYDALKATLAAHGLDLRHVVKENLYATDLDAMIRHKEVRNAFYRRDKTEFPAATWVGVQRLFTPQMVLEVELVAVFPKKSADKGS